MAGASLAGCRPQSRSHPCPSRVQKDLFRSLLVYLDAFVLEDGESLAQHLPEEQYKMLFEGANARGEGWKVPPIPGEVCKVNAQDVLWMNQQCTPHPIYCFRQRIALTGGIQNIINVTF